MLSISSRATRASLRPPKKCGVANTATQGCVAHISGRKLRGFVTDAGNGLLEVAPKRELARVFASPAEAQRALDAALGLFMHSVRLVISSAGGDDHA